jgi:hypothetical protein
MQWKAIYTERVFVRSEDYKAHPKVEEVVTECVKKGVGVVVIQKDDVLRPDCDAVGDKFSMTCIAVNSHNNGASDGEDEKLDENENANSIAWLVKFGKYRYYTAGDLSAEFEDPLGAGIKAGGPLTAIKCGHHGSSTSTSTKFLDETKPRIAFASAGKQKKFRHPNGETLLRLLQAPATEAIYVTNCYAPQPVIYHDYFEVMHSSLRLELVSAFDKLKAWQIPDIPVDWVKNEGVWSKIAAVQKCITLREGWIVLCENLRGCVDWIGNECHEDSFCAALSGVQNAVERLNEWGNKNQPAAISLRNGIQVGVGEGRKKVVVQVDVTKGGSLFKEVSKHLTEVKRMSDEILAAQHVINDTDLERAANIAAVTGTSDCMGTVQLLMRANDCDKDDRTCFVGYERGGWEAFRYLVTDGAIKKVEAPPSPLPSRKLLTMLSRKSVSDVALVAPLTPNTYLPYLEELETEQQDHAVKFPGSYLREVATDTPEPTIAPGSSSSNRSDDDEERKSDAGQDEEIPARMDPWHDEPMSSDITTEDSGEERKYDNSEEAVPISIDPPDDEVPVRSPKRKAASYSGIEGDSNSKREDKEQPKKLRADDAERTAVEPAHNEELAASKDDDAGSASESSPVAT